MEHLRITKDNIDKEHIACALSGSKSSQKKECCSHNHHTPEIVG